MKTRQRTTNTTTMTGRALLLSKVFSAFLPCISYFWLKTNDLLIVWLIDWLIDSTGVQHTLPCTFKDGGGANNDDDSIRHKFLHLLHCPVYSAHRLLAPTRVFVFTNLCDFMTPCLSMTTRMLVGMATTSHDVNKDLMIVRISAHNWMHFFCTVMMMTMKVIQIVQFVVVMTREMSNTDEKCDDEWWLEAPK